MAALNTRNIKPALPPQGGTPPRVFEPSNTRRTHEGAPAAQISPEMALRRSVCACLLWEDTFYESGQDVAARITELAGQVAPTVLAQLAIDARSHLNLRHVPLLLCAVLARTGSGTRIVSDTISQTIQRADELSEFLAVYARANGVEPKALKKKLSAQVKKGLAAAFAKFDRYALAKYFSPSGEAGQPIKGRDVMFLVHPKPRDAEQAALWKQLVAGEVKSADTWEVGLSAGPAEGVSKEQHKRAVFEGQLRDGKLGYLALLRNLRNMTEAGVDPSLVSSAILARKGARRVLPFRYVAAARAAPAMVPFLDPAMRAAVAELPALPGRTVVLVDVSGSMNQKISAKSDLSRIDAAAALAVMIHGDVRIYTFSNRVAEVSRPAGGLSGIQQILLSQPHQGTELGAAVQTLNSGVEMDRLIVITDEQSGDHVPEPRAARAYLINVAAYQNGVGYGERWTHLDGFSEQVIRWVHEFEALI
ncbi:MAG TPA: VWA domain-containing protein [Actinomycetota bacterium]|nr:VWA domain-containing protein [Actinomycetota bacterium]